MRRLLLVTLLVVFASSATSSAAKPRFGQFVGQAGKVSIGVSLGAEQSIAYACDGKHVGTWLRGPALTGDTVTLEADAGRLELTVDGKNLEAGFEDTTARLRPATGDAGLYRSENKVGSKGKLAGWVVQRSGKQVGVLQSGTRLSSAPALSTSTLLAGQLVVSPVVDISDVGPLVLDLDGDGIDVSGAVTTSLLGGAARLARWTVAGDDDAFIGFDSAALRALGYAVNTTGVGLVRGGLTVTRNRVSTTTVQGFQFLRVLDANADGRIDASDPAFSALRVLRDNNANGNFGDTPGLSGGDMVAEMAAMSMEFLALQEATQMESRKFQTLSNASRARHDIALNAIRSLK